MKKVKILGLPYVFWLGLFVIFPMLLIIFYTFTNRSGDLSLDNLKNFFAPLYLKVLWLSVSMALVTTLLCLLIGYPVAMLISTMNEKKRYRYLILIIVPTWMNFLLRTYSWMNILAKNGLINLLLEWIGLNTADLLYNDGAVLLGMVYNFLPFMIYPICSILMKMDTNCLDASRDLGATPFQSFWRITFPLSVPGVVTGVTMVFVPAMSTFVIPDLLGGAQKMYIGNVISHQFLQKGDLNFGSAVSVIMMILVLISMYVASKFDPSSKKEKSLW